jgi:hypothetical protein
MLCNFVLCASASNSVSDIVVENVCMCVCVYVCMCVCVYECMCVCVRLGDLLTGENCS